MHHRAATIHNFAISPSTHDARRPRLLVVDDHAERIPAPGTVPLLPPIVLTVLTQAARHRRSGQITTVKFAAQVERLAREELEPRGLSVLVRDLPRGITRFIIKTTATGQVQDIIEIKPDRVPAENAHANNHLYK
jgi:hypothetical protein